MPDCIVKFKAAFKDKNGADALYEYIKGKAGGIEYDGSEAWENAIKEVQQENLSNLEKIYNELDEKTKGGQDAVPIESTDEMDVRQQTTDGKGVGEGNIQPEIPTGKEEKSKDTGEEEVGDDDLSGIKKALVPDDIVKNTDFEKIGDEEMMAMGRKVLGSGEVNPDALVTKIITDGKGVLTPAEVVGLITYKRDIDNAVKDKTSEFNKKKAAGQETGTLGVEIAKLEKQIEDYNVMSLITAQQQSLAFRLRQYLLDQNYNAVREIERYKKVNNGTIPPEVEARIKAVEKELKEVKEKLSKAEEANRDVEGQEAVDNIKESVGREKKYTEEELENKVNEGVQSEINKIYEQLPSDKKTLADKAIAALENIQKKLRGKTYSDVTGFTAIVDAGITTIKNAIKLGVSVQRAVELGINKIKEKLGNKKWDKEDEFRKDMIDGFENEGVSTKKIKDKPTINEDGTVSIPNQMIRDIVSKGVTDINDITDTVHEQVKKDLPSITKRQVRDYITDYGKKVNPTADDIQTQINTAKRVGRLLSELEDLNNKKRKEKNQGNINKLTDKERELKRKINSLIRDTFGKEEKSDEQKLFDSKERTKTRIEDLERKLKNKDFAKKTKKTSPTDEELEKLKIEENKLITEIEEIQYKNELKNRTLAQKIEDEFYEWTLGITRGLTLGVDLSAIGIQGMRHLFISPVKSAQAFWESLKFLANEKYGNRFLARLKASPYYPQMAQTGLIIDDKVSKVNVREAIGISNKVNYLWNKLVSPVLGFGDKTATEWFRKKNPYAAGQRAFDGFVNVLRTKLYIEQAKELERSGYRFESDPEVFKKSAGLVNTETASAHLGKADLNSRWLNLIFTAPRKFVSEFKLYTPYALIYYARLPKPVRKRALLNAAKFTVSFVTVNAAIWAMRKDWDDEEDEDHFWDITSSDFMTHKIGDKRIGIGGGAKSMINFIGRFWKGEYTDQYGKTAKLGERFGKEINSRADLTISFTTGKFTPLLSTAYKKLDESKGRANDNEELIRNLVIPMWMQDLKEVYKDDPVTVGAFINIMSILGAQTRIVEPQKITTPTKGPTPPQPPKMKQPPTRKMERTQ